MSENTKYSTAPVLVITLESSMKPVEELEAYRDYVLKGLSAGVLVLGKGVTYRIEDFPLRSGVMVQSDQEVQEEDPIIRAHDFAHMNNGDGKRKLSFVSTDQVVKTEILKRLKTYRDTNGLGCLEAVAKATRSKAITSMVLRDVLLGSAVLDKSDWLKIGRALDKLEGKGVSTSEEEGENG